jgi:hypothetical protein
MRQDLLDQLAEVDAELKPLVSELKENNPEPYKAAKTATERLNSWKGYIALILAEKRIRELVASKKTQKSDMPIVVFERDGQKQVLYVTATAWNPTSFKLTDGWAFIRYMETQDKADWVKIDVSVNTDTISKKGFNNWFRSLIEGGQWVDGVHISPVTLKATQEVPEIFYTTAYDPTNGSNLPEVKW